MSVAIITKHLGPTNHRGSRIKAFRADAPRVSVTIANTYSSGPAGDHDQAAKLLAQKLDWTGTMTRGSTWDGYVYVFSDRAATVIAGEPTPENC